MLHHLGMLILRLTIGIVAAYHYGYLWYQKASSLSLTFGPIYGLDQATSFALLNWCNMIGGSLIILGLFSRFGALMLLFSFFTYNLILSVENSWVIREVPMLVLGFSLGILILGAGNISLGALIFRRPRIKY